jgi:hypothetical protein
MLGGAERRLERHVLADMLVSWGEFAPLLISVVKVMCSLREIKNAQDCFK